MKIKGISDKGFRRLVRRIDAQELPIPLNVDKFSIDEETGETGETGEFFENPDIPNLSLNLVITTDKGDIWLSSDEDKTGEWFWVYEDDTRTWGWGEVVSLDEVNEKLNWKVSDLEEIRF